MSLTCGLTGQANPSNPFSAAFAVMKSWLTTTERQEILSRNRRRQDNRGLNHVVNEYQVDEDHDRSEVKDFLPEELMHVRYTAHPRPSPLPRRVRLEMESYWSLDRIKANEIAANRPWPFGKRRLRYRNFCHRFVLEMPAHLQKRELFIADRHVRFQRVDEEEGIPLTELGGPDHASTPEVRGEIPVPKASVAGEFKATTLQLWNENSHHVSPEVDAHLVPQIVLYPSEEKEEG
jgi:hypothetical protein